jgi:hypothetical protein
MGVRVIVRDRIGIVVREDRLRLSEANPVFSEICSALRGSHSQLILPLSYVRIVRQKLFWEK